MINKPILINFIKKLINKKKTRRFFAIALIKLFESGHDCF